MKKLSLPIMAFCFSFMLISTQLKAGTENNSITTSEARTVESAAANALIFRLNEINAMDKSKLNSTEKKELRKEVKSIRTQLKESGGGVYLSLGAIIIIILLLILLL